jgi:hypothetical protein
MRTLSGLARLTRIGSWLSSEFLLFGVVGIVLGLPAPLYLSYLGYAALVLSFGYGVNNYFDRWQDARAGKQFLYPHDLPRGVVYSMLILCAVGALIVAFIYFRITGLLIAIVNLVLALSYSMPPVRLKERGWLALPAIGLAQFSLPLLVVLAIPSLSSIQLGCILWLFVYGMVDVLLHQLEDLSRDQKASVDTFVRKANTGLTRTIIILFSLLQLGITSLVFAVTGLIGTLVLILFTASQLKELWFSVTAARHSHILRLDGICQNQCTFCEYLGNKQHVSRALSRQKHVVIGGCEPVESASFERTVQSLRPASIELMTTARPFSDIARLRRVMGLGIHDYLIYLFGPTGDIHDSVTRSPGSYVETVAGLDNLSRLQAHISFFMVLSGANYRSIDDMLRFAEQYRPKAIHVQVIAPFHDSEPIPFDDLFALLNRIRHLSLSDSRIIVRDPFLRCRFLTNYVDDGKRTMEYGACSTCMLAHECEVIKR